VKAGTRHALTGLLWISPWLVGFAAFMLLPIAMSLYYSLTDYPLLEPPLFIGGGNYARMLTDEVFHKTLINTLIYAGASIPLSTALALGIAALLNRKMRMGGFFQAAVFVPTLVPMVAAAMVWMWLFNGEYGLINRLLGVVGVRGPNWLLDRHWAMPALIIMSLWGVGQAVVLYLAALKDVPEQLYEAADLDGMGPVRRFFNVTLPMISPVVLFNVITLTIGTFQVFAIPWIIFQKDKGGPGQSGYFYTMYLYDNAFTYGQMGYANALAWVQLLIILGLTALMFALSRRFVHYRAA